MTKQATTTRSADLSHATSISPKPKSSPIPNSNFSKDHQSALRPDFKGSPTLSHRDILTKTTVKPKAVIETEAFPKVLNFYTKLQQAVLVVAYNLEFFAAPFQDKNFQRWAGHERPLIEKLSLGLHEALNTVDEKSSLESYYSFCLIGEYSHPLDAKTNLKSDMGNLKQGDPSAFYALLLKNPKLVDAILAFKSGSPNIVDKWYHDHKGHRDHNRNKFFEILGKPELQLPNLKEETELLWQISYQMNNCESSSPEHDYLNEVYSNIYLRLKSSDKPKEKVSAYLENVAEKKVTYFNDLIVNPFLSLLPGDSHEGQKLLSEIDNKLAELANRIRAPGLSNESSSVLMRKYLCLRRAYFKLYFFLKDTKNMDKFEKLSVFVKSLHTNPDIQTFFYTQNGFSTQSSRETGTGKLINKLDEFIEQHWFNQHVSDKGSFLIKIPENAKALLSDLVVKINELKTRMERYQSKSSLNILKKKCTYLQAALRMMYTLLKHGSIKNLEKLSAYMETLQGNEVIKTYSYGPSTSRFCFLKPKKTDTELLIDRINEFVRKYDEIMRAKYIFRYE